MRQIILVGGGGHCKACIDIIEQSDKYAVGGIVDLPEKQGEKVLGYPVIGTDEDLGSLAHRYTDFLVTAGQIQSPALRRRLFYLIKEVGGNSPVLISPHAQVSRHARIGEGSIVMHGAIVNAAAVVGRNTIINTRALVEHDAIIGDHCHLATGGIVNGGAKIGEGSFVGSGAVVREYVEVGEACLIGGHVFVRKDVAPNTILR